MELKRRQFLKMVLGALALAATGLLAAVKQALPRCVVRAARIRRFPGAVRPLDPDEVGAPGVWRG